MTSELVGPPRWRTPIGRILQIVAAGQIDRAADGLGRVGRLGDDELKVQLPRNIAFVIGLPNPRIVDGLRVKLTGTDGVLADALGDEGFTLDFGGGGLGRARRIEILDELLHIGGGEMLARQVWCHSREQGARLEALACRLVLASPY